MHLPHPNAQVKSVASVCAKAVSRGSLPNGARKGQSFSACMKWHAQNLELRLIPALYPTALNETWFRASADRSDAALPMCATFELHVPHPCHSENTPPHG